MSWFNQKREREAAAQVEAIITDLLGIVKGSVYQFTDATVAYEGAIASLESQLKGKQAECDELRGRIVAQVSYTYSSTQATNCAGCGKHKHTPLRVDLMDGYVCLTCIDQRLELLLQAEAGNES